MTADRETRFDALLFDVGGVLLLPDPTVLGPLLAYYGGDESIDAHRRAHYRGMAVKSAAGSGETFWDEYNHAYVRALGITDSATEAAAAIALENTRNAYLWRWPIPDSLEALAHLQAAGVPMGVVSNASGQVEESLWRSGVCAAVADDDDDDRRGPQAATMRVIVDSHVVGVAKPDPRIFDYALAHFDGVERSRIAYIGDSVTMDIGGATAAGLHPILIDPYDDHAGAPFERIGSLLDLCD